MAFHATFSIRMVPPARQKWGKCLIRSDILARVTWECKKLAASHGCGSKIGTQNETLVNGTKDQNLRSPGWWFHFDPYPRENATSWQLHIQTLSLQNDGLAVRQGNHFLSSAASVLGSKITRFLNPKCGRGCHEERQNQNRQQDQHDHLAHIETQEYVELTMCFGPTL